MFLWNGRIQSWLCSVCIPNFSKKFIRKISIDLKFLTPNHGVILGSTFFWASKNLSIFCFCRSCCYQILSMEARQNFCVTNFSTNTDPYGHCFSSNFEHIPFFPILFMITVISTVLEEDSCSNGCNVLMFSCSVTIRELPFFD